MKKDTYEEVINHQETYDDIAFLLKTQSVCIGWTDQAGTHLDILFSLGAKVDGHLQGGVQMYDLFVSIMRVGAFGFKIEKQDTHPGYYGEKLGIGYNTTTEKLAELINGVKKSIARDKIDA